MEDNQRSKRESKAPSWMYEVEHPDAALAKLSGAHKYVYRLLTRHDVTSKLRNREVFVYWPDNDTWYRGKIEKVDPDSFTADIYYEDTDEQEEGTDISELITEKQIAFKETRALNHVNEDDEIDVGQEYIPPSESEHEDHSSDEDIDDEDHSDSHHHSDSESDPSYSSEQEKRPKRKSKGIHSDDDDSSGGRSSAQKKRKYSTKNNRSKSRNDVDADGDDEDAFAERLLQKVQDTRPDSRTSKKKERIQQQLSAMKQSNSQHAAEIRSKVRDSLQTPLNLAHKELSSKYNNTNNDNTTNNTSDDNSKAKLESIRPQHIAIAIEDALFRLYHGTTKEYKSKLRSLYFNLKDPHNPDLRAHVLLGDITPDQFVRMTATELASKEVAEYRKQKEEQALKMSVLDAEAAAKFSTAAALEAKEVLALPAQIAASKLLAGADASIMNTTTTGDNGNNGNGGDSVVKEESSGGGGGGGGGSAQKKEERNTHHQHTTTTTTTNTTTTAPPVAATIDWALIKEQAVVSAPSPIPPNTTTTTINNTTTNTLATADTTTMIYDDDINDENNNDDSDAILPFQQILLDNNAVHQVLIRNIWESNISVPGNGIFPVDVNALAGCGDLAVLLGPGSNTSQSIPPLTIKGRLALSKLDSFLSELHLSKHRTATVGVLRCADDATEVERTGWHEVVAQLRQRSRTGVIESVHGVEVYLVPQSELTSKILEAAKVSQPMAYELSFPDGRTELPEEMVVVVAIHKKELKAIAGLHKSVKRKTSPVVYNNTSNNGGGLPALPAGLDLSAISALASALGVTTTNTMNNNTNTTMNNGGGGW